MGFKTKHKEIMDKKRSDLCDFILLQYYRIVFRQACENERRIDVLLEYINELEYRGLKYE